MVYVLPELSSISHPHLLWSFVLTTIISALSIIALARGFSTATFAFGSDDNGWTYFIAQWIHCCLRMNRCIWKTKSVKQLLYVSIFINLCRPSTETAAVIVTACYSCAAWAAVAQSLGLIWCRNCRGAGPTTAVVCNLAASSLLSHLNNLLYVPYSSWHSLSSPYLMLLLHCPVSKILWKFIVRNFLFGSIKIHSAILEYTFDWSQ